MSKRDTQDERLTNILGDLETVDFDDSIDTLFEYLQFHLSLPCKVIGIKDFGWEEIYVLGPGNKNDYEKLKKKQPSYTDKYELLQLVRQADAWWVMHEDEDIGACVRRISDGKEFVLGLSELEATDKKSKNYELLNDYSVWFVNNRGC